MQLKPGDFDRQLDNSNPGHQSNLKKTSLKSTRELNSGRRNHWLKKNWLTDSKWVTNADLINF